MSVDTFPTWTNDKYLLVSDNHTVGSPEITVKFGSHSSYYETNNIADVVAAVQYAPTLEQAVANDSDFAGAQINKLIINYKGALSKTGHGDLSTNGILVTDSSIFD